MLIHNVYIKIAIKMRELDNPFEHVTINHVSSQSNQRKLNGKKPSVVYEINFANNDPITKQYQITQSRISTNEYNTCHNYMQFVCVICPLPL